MKRIILSCCLIFCLLLGGCRLLEIPQEEESRLPSIIEASTSASGNMQQGQAPVVNSAFALYEAKYHYAGAIMLNEPFDEDLEYTHFWVEGEYERAYLIPRYVESYVNLYGILWDEEGGYTLTDKAVHSCYVEDGCIIYGAFERPEGFPHWYLEIVAPDGRTAGYVLSYDGRFGTPPIEPIPFDPEQ